MNSIQTIGILRSNWYDSNNQLILYNYGTAFAINKWILVTCTHNICYGHTKDYASEVIFITDVSNGNVTPCTQRYKSIKGKYYRSQAPRTIYNMRPVKQQLSLIILEEPIEAENFLKIGQISPTEIESQMKVIGFPSLKYKSACQLDSIQVQRIQSTGILYQPFNVNLNSHILDYTMKTAKGVSGSPVLVKQDDGIYKVVAIHTHKGLTQKYNSGLYFSSAILEKIGQWLRQIKNLCGFVFEQVFSKQSDNNSTNDQSSQNSQFSELLYLEESSFYSQEQKSQFCLQDQEEEYENKSAIQTDCDIFDQVLELYLHKNDEQDQVLSEIQLQTVTKLSTFFEPTRIE